MHIHIDTQQQKSRLMKLASYASVSIATILLITQLIIGLIINSASMLSSAAESLGDLFASLVAFFGVKYATKPADGDHRFGHGKAEHMAAAIQAIFIFTTATILICFSAYKLYNPDLVDETSLINTTYAFYGVGVILFSLVITFLLISFQTFVVNKTGSSAIKADLLHYKGDVFLNLGVIISVISSYYFGITWADPIFAIGVALYMMYNAYQIIKDNIDNLMDKEILDNERNQIIGLIKHPKLISFHDLKTRQSGIQKFVQFHIKLNRNLTLHEVHKICDDIEENIKHKFPSIEVLIHADPDNEPEHGFKN